MTLLGLLDENIALLDRDILLLDKLGKQPSVAFLTNDLEKDFHESDHQRLVLHVVSSLTC